MRIIAGEDRGRRLVAPEGTTTRPTSDRVRESMFNTLYSLGVLDDAVVADLYAGSGSLGLEALSRGAGSCVFVEQNRDALEAIEENIETLRYTDRATVVSTEVVSWLERLGSRPQRFDLVLADPPYGDHPWERLLDLVDSAFVVAESSEPIAPHQRWDVVRSKTYGTTLVTVLAEKIDPS